MKMNNFAVVECDFTILYGTQKKNRHNFQYVTTIPYKKKQYLQFFFNKLEAHYRDFILSSINR